VNLFGLTLGTVLVVAGAAGWVVSVRVNGEGGPLVDWWRARRARTEAEAAAVGAEGEEQAAFAFAGKVHYGSSVRVRLLAVFWIIIIIGVVSTIIAVSLWQLGHLINSTIQHFVKTG